MGVQLFNVSLPKELQNDASGEVYFRPLKIDDIDKNFISLLSQLTSAPNISKSSFDAVFQKMISRLVHDFLQLGSKPVFSAISHLTIFCGPKFLDTFVI